MLLTSSPVPPEQGSCVGQLGFLIRLCPCASQDMSATPPQTPSRAHALIRAMLTLVLAHRRDEVGTCCRASRQLGNISQSANKTSGFECLQTEKRARSRCPKVAGHLLRHLLLSFKRQKQPPLLYKGLLCPWLLDAHCEPQHA